MANTKITTNVIADDAITSAKLDTNIAIAGTLGVTGNITGTLATAAQTNITSLGTLTGLTGGTGDLNWDSGTLFVDSSANAVGIGTSSPDEPLHIFSSTDADLLLEGTETGTSTRFAKVAFANNISGTTTDLGAITADTDGATNSSAFKFYTANAGSVTNKMTITSGGNVGIGGSPDTQLNIKNADDAVVRIESTGSESGDDARLEIKTTNGTFTIQNDRSLGTSGALTFAGNTSDNIVIDHNDGSVGIGTTSSISSSSSSSSTGFWFDTADYLAVARNSQRVAIFNRIGTDGEIVAIRKDGSTVGSIGTANGDLHIDGGASHSGIRFQQDSLMPRQNGADINGAIDLGYNDGSTAFRFRNLNLSGSIYLGGLGSANALDDYEEGTYIPTWTTVTGNPASYRNADTSTNNSTNGLSYVKIGRQVTISGAVFFSSGNSINNQRPNMSIPFDARVYSVSGIISSYGTGSQPNVNYLNWAATNSINLFKLDSSGSHTAFGGNGGIELYINITYQTYT